MILLGYILPITQHTYQNYQYRMLDDNRNPHHVGKLYKVGFKQITREKNDYQLYSLSEEPGNGMQPRLEEHPIKTLRKHYYIHQLEKAELTGKGGVMNKLI